MMIFRQRFSLTKIVIIYQTSDKLSWNGFVIPNDSIRTVSLVIQDSLDPPLSPYMLRSRF